ncbi:MAG: hypothetical protein RLY66_554 [Candidatus Parcubacteria bacterium]|jgi:beta-1,4-mannosyl-glycoprotein beta-1,4-N-acetylglucosaminyltransferase
MKNLPNVTLVAVTSIKIPETVAAMRKSMADIQFGQVLLLTNEKISLEACGIKVVHIEKLDYKGYSEFMLYKLKDYIKTDFALVVQYDGYVTRPSSWSDEFLKYDYIGAPWRKDQHFTPEGVNVRVGNGGFSLRSKKLLEAPTKLNLPFTDGGNGKGYFNEDGNVCVYHRKTLEESGVLFAPVEVASRFSRETICDDSYDKPFGFHGNKGSSIVRLKSFIASKFARKIVAKIKSESKEHVNIARRTISSLKNDLSSHIDIQRHRKSAEVYDIFTFFNELDLLEMRLNILDPFVDHFVIVEATETFSGKPKPLYFADNKDRFKKWEHKIIHHVIRDTPVDKKELQDRLEYLKRKNLSTSIDAQIINDVLNHNTLGKGNIDWTKELYQKESLKKALANIKDNDICYISDADEIWNPHAKMDYSKDHLFRLRQYMYAYFLNNRSSENWIGPLVAKYKNIKNEYLNDLRSEKKTSYTYVRNGGWHFTNMGGADQIRKKIESYGHQEYNNDTIKSRIEDMIRGNKDFIGRKFKFWVDESDLPKFILENRQKYAHLFRPTDTLK